MSNTLPQVGCALVHAVVTIPDKEMKSSLKQWNYFFSFKFVDFISIYRKYCFKIQIYCWNNTFHTFSALHWSNKTLQVKHSQMSVPAWNIIRHRHDNLEGHIRNSEDITSSLCQISVGLMEKASDLLWLSMFKDAELKTHKLTSKNFLTSNNLCLNICAMYLWTFNVHSKKKKSNCLHANESSQYLVLMFWLFCSIIFLKNLLKKVNI